MHMSNGHYPILADRISLKTEYLTYTEQELKSQVTLNEIQEFIQRIREKVSSAIDNEAKKDIVLGEYSIAFADRPIIDFQVQTALQAEYPFMYILY